MFTWGKGDNYRLGHGTEEHIRFPKLIEDLNESVVDVSVGAMHVVAVTKVCFIFTLELLFIKLKLQHKIFFLKFMVLVIFSSIVLFKL